MVAWMVFCFCMSAWANTKEETYFHIASALFLYGFVKITWFLVKESYKTFEREQQDLLNTIKNSDKR